MSMHLANDRRMFGLWVYLMTDLLMFATLFATYAVLRDATYGGPSGKELFHLPPVLVETLILLTSSFTSGLAIIAVHAKKQDRAMAWFAVTFLLGLAFLGMEISEFSTLIAEGNGPDRSAFLSSFFTLVGTHGLHIAVGLVWLGVSMVQVKLRGLSPFVVPKLERFSLYWHFLDIVWVFIFTTVYLIGHVA